MPNYLAASLTNAAVASLLALAALAVCRAWRNPFVNRGVWLAVLLKFVAPPLILLPLVRLPDLGQSELPHQAAIASEPLSQAPRPGSPLEAPPAAGRADGSQPATASPAIDAHKTATAVAALRPRAAFHRTVDPVGSRQANHGGRALPATQLPFSTLATAAWLAGSVVLLAISLHRILRFHAALARSRVASHGWQRRTRRLAAAAGLKRPPLVRLTAGRTPPLAWRLWRRSTIVLPAELLAHVTAAEAEAILAHEVMHLRRRDDRLRWLELAVVAAWWWCPLAWLARRRLHEAEERCCDADALRTFPDAAAHYARALLATLDFVAPAPRLALAGAPFMDRGSLVRRFEMITSRRLPAPPTRRSRTLLLAACGAVLLTTPIARSVEAQPCNAEIQADQPATIQLSDGTLVEGRIASIKDGRVLVVMPSATLVEPDKSDAQKPAEPASALPAASSNEDEPNVAETAGPNEPESDRPVTLFRSNGDRIVGRWRRDGDSILFVPDDPSFGTHRLPPDFLPRSKAPATAGEQPEELELFTEWSLWDLSLKECLDIAFDHNQAILHTKRSAENAVLSRDATAGPQLDRADLRHVVDNVIHDVCDAYWELYFAYRDLDAGKIARDGTLAAWRRVKTLQRAGSVGGEDNAEAQARSQYYLHRAAVEKALTNLFRVENRLRYLLGLAPSDGRLIRANDKPDLDQARYDTKALHDMANSNRQKLQKQRTIVEQREAEIADAQLLAENANEVSAVELKRRLAMVQHRQLLLNRDRAVLKDIELEVSHQLNDVLRDVDLHYGVAAVNFNRLAAAKDEVEAVDRLYEVGQVPLDRVLDAQGRLAESTSAYHRSLADYQRAKLRVELHAGRILEHFGYRLP